VAQKQSLNSFFREEIPKSRIDSGINKPSIPSDDQIAYPGGSCSRGQECLLDSMCNGTICVCNKGLFTLNIGDTYNCVPENPALAGFGDGSNIVIALTPNNQTNDEVSNSTNSSNMSEETSTKNTLTSSSINLIPSLILVAILSFLLYC
jgi:hypothetical protein